VPSFAAIDFDSKSSKRNVYLIVNNYYLTNGYLSVIEELLQRLAATIHKGHRFNQMASPGPDRATGLKKPLTLNPSLKT
jgi:hypothetical protein